MVWITLSLVTYGFSTSFTLPTSITTAVISSKNGITIQLVALRLAINLLRYAQLLQEFEHIYIDYQDMRFLSRAQHGVDETIPGVHESVLNAYQEDHPEVPPDVLDNFYGVEGPERQRAAHQTGAGHPPDEEDLDEQLDDMIGQEENTNVRHDAIDVPESNSPFTPDVELLFLEALRELQQSGTLPGNYKVTEEEWQEEDYPETEILGVGRRKKLAIQLPLDIWLPRARMWAQALDLMVRLEEEL